MKLNHTFTEEFARSMWRYEPHTGLILARKDGKRIGFQGPRYWQIRFEKKTYFAHRLVWLLVNGSWPKQNLDHINGNRSDNRIENLREANQVQNLANCKKYSNNKSGVKGVWWDSTRKKWAAQLKYDGKKYHIGRFAHKTKAVIAYNQMAVKLRGEYARIN